jgi:poly-gamma-glutamate capsule biosynthesis protein CapA/YwtB (metallophosphatase superfamily)
MLSSGFNPMRWKNLPHLLVAAAASLTVAGQNQPVRVLFVGDVMLDNGPGHIITNGGDPFAPTAEVLYDAELTIGNLECAITRQGHHEDKPYQFKGPQSALPLLKRYFSAVSLANNHSGDWGKAGFSDELTLLRQSQIPYFGGGADEKEAWKPLVLEARGRRVAFLGFNGFPPRGFEAKGRKPGSAWLIPDRIVGAIAEARSRYQADYVLLFLHWGNELVDHPEPEQQALARRFIDAGADAVIGGHPHVTQTIDWHRGKPIVYSLGNYMFDYYPTDPPLWTGWMARVTLGAPEGVGLELFHIEIDPAGVPHLKSTVPERILPR